MKIKCVNSHLERKNMALENKLNITDSTELARMEEKISKKKAVELFENGYLNKKLALLRCLQQFINIYLVRFMILLEK